jgi:hypothetical protein
MRVAMIFPIPRAVREFVAGLGAVRRFATIERPEEMRAALHKAVQIRSELEIDEPALRQQLTSETAARKEAERKLDALTRWRRQSDEPCPDLGELIHVLVTDNILDALRVTSSHASIYNYWRFTPESLEAAEKVGSDD